MSQHRIPNQLRALAQKIETDWSKQSGIVLNYSTTDYNERYKIIGKRYLQRSDYATAAGNLLLETFENGAFRKDYGLCNILGEWRKRRQSLLRKPKRMWNHYTPEGCANRAFRDVCRHWLKYPRRGFDWRWKYRYLELEQSYALICRALAEYLEQEVELLQKTAKESQQESTSDCITTTEQE